MPRELPEMIGGAGQKTTTLLVGGLCYRRQHPLEVLQGRDFSMDSPVSKSSLDALGAHDTFTPRPTGSGQRIDHHNMLR